MTCTNFRAEVEAISAAPSHLNTQEDIVHGIVILTDSLSALQQLTARDADTSVRGLQDSLQHLCTHDTVVLQWIPAHCGILGNKQADGLAKAGSMQDEPEVELSFQEAKTLLKHKSRSDWRTQGIYNAKQDSIRLLRREQAATIAVSVPT